MADNLPTFYEQYHQLLTYLAADTALIDAFRQAGDMRSWWPVDLKWFRIFQRFDPERSPSVTLAFESRGQPQRICVAELFDACPQANSAAEFVLRTSSIGWLRLTRFPHDPQLTGLVQLMQDFDQVEVLRYRPHKRCTLRVWDRQTNQYQFAKVFADQRGEAIHRESLSLWAAAERGELNFSVAQPLHWDAGQRTLWQGVVAGAPIIEPLFCASGHRMAARMGRACASITQAGLQPSRKYGPEVQLARTRRYARELTRWIPDRAQDFEDFLAQLARLYAKVGDQPLKPIHGAPHAHQWLDTGTRLGLVDFDRFSIGHPELDAATFMAEMDYESPEKMPVEELNEAFLSGYQSVAGALNMPLLTAYRAQKHFAKAFKASSQLRPDAKRRALRNFSRAQAWLNKA